MFYKANPAIPLPSKDAPDVLFRQQSRYSYTENHTRSSNVSELYLFSSALFVG